MPKKKIYFRADAGSGIGYGHFIRTLALADMLKDDFDCTFFTTSPTAYQIGEMEKVCAFVALHQEDKFHEFLLYLNGDEIVVLDNYFYTTNYQRRIKLKGSTLVCIDDMHDKHYVADVVINQDIRDTSLFSVESYTRLCLGLGYALLRAPFLQNIDMQIHNRDVIAISYGGSDPLDLTGRTIKQLLSVVNTSVIAIVGDAYTPKEGKYENKQVEYKSRLTAEGMAEIFSRSKLVICSASTVCLEALSCGAPVAVGWYVDNQKEYYNILKEQNSVIALGYLPNADLKITSNPFRLANRPINGNVIIRNIRALFNELAEL